MWKNGKGATTRAPVGANNSESNLLAIIFRQFVENKFEPITVNELLYYFSLLRSYSRAHSFPDLVFHLFFIEKNQTKNHPNLYQLNCVLWSFGWWHTFCAGCFLLLLHLILLLTCLALQLLRLPGQCWHLKHIVSLCQQFHFAGIFTRPAFSLGLSPLGSGGSPSRWRSACRGWWRCRTRCQSGSSGRSSDCSLRNLTKNWNWYLRHYKRLITHITHSAINQKYICCWGMF